MDAALATRVMPGSKTTRRALLLMLAFAALWAVLEVALGASLREPYDLMQIVWWRYATHLVLLVAAFGWRRPSRLWRTRHTGLQLGRSMLMLVMPLSFAMSLSFGASADFTWAVFWVAPLAVLLLARLLLRERASGLLWTCAATVPLAAMLIHQPQVPAGVAAMALPFAMALSFSLYVVATRALRREPLATNLFYTAFGVFALLTPFVPHVWRTPSLHDAVVLCAIGAIGLLALALLDRSVEHDAVSVVTPVAGMYMPFVIALSALHGEAPHRRGVIAALLLGAVFALLWQRASTLGAGPLPPSSGHAHGRPS
jgi:drug/metabolite transporter (DMT)-like permease